MVRRPDAALRPRRQTALRTRPLDQHPCLKTPGTSRSKPRALPSLSLGVCALADNVRDRGHERHCCSTTLGQTPTRGLFNHRAAPNKRTRTTARRSKPGGIPGCPASRMITPCFSKCRALHICSGLILRGGAFESTARGMVSAELGGHEERGHAETGREGAAQGHRRVHVDVRACLLLYKAPP